MDWRKNKKSAITGEDRYLSPIARFGEPQFAAIIRNRSGVDSGEIDYGYRSPPDDWTDFEKSELATTALLLYEAIVRDTGQRGSGVVVGRVKALFCKEGK